MPSSMGNSGDGSPLPCRARISVSPGRPACHDPFLIQYERLQGGRLAAQPAPPGGLPGHIRLHPEHATIDLPVGHVAMLDGDISHDVEAAEDSAFLLTIASA